MRQRLSSWSRLGSCRPSSATAQLSHWRQEDSKPAERSRQPFGHLYALSDAKLEPLQRIKVAKAFFADVPTDIRSGGNLAYYNIGQDFVQLPPFEAFRDAESFYATKAHELAHWTRHEKRLNRSFGRKRWGDEGYAAEELVAELASAFLCADLGLTPEVREDHASYIAQWLEVLKNDRRAIFTAASHAQKAADYLAAFSQMKEMAA